MMLINLIYTILPIVTMIIGFCLGFNIKKRDELPEIPEIKAPSTMIRERKKRKQEEQKEDEIAIYLENIDNYPYNQKEC